MPAKPKKTASKPAPTSLVTFLLDRSSSMNSCKAATIEAFNGYISGLQAEKDAAISFTFLQFDTESLDKLCVAEPIASVHPLTNASYQPRGGTPLIDAAVKTIRAVEASLSARDDKPRVVVCIQTDGEENSSTEHTWEELRGLVTEKTAAGWQFNFMGAGIDGYAQATRMGIGAISTMSYDSTNLGNTRAAFAASASNAADFSAGRSMNTQYSPAQRSASGDRHAANWIGGMTGTPHAPIPPAPAAQLDLTKPAPSGARSNRPKSIADFAL